MTDLAPHPASGHRAEPHPEFDIVEAYQRAGLCPGRIPIGTSAATVGDLRAMSIPSMSEGARFSDGAETFRLGGPARTSGEHGDAWAGDPRAADDTGVSPRAEAKTGGWPIR